MKHFILLFIFILALSLRSINFSQTLNFANDQGEFLLESAKILNGEPIKLIGIYVSSKPVENKYFFIGSQFLYLLAFFQKILNYDPLKITYTFVIINSIAVVGTYVLAKKWFGEKTALVSSLLYATNPFAINYSKLIWNPTIQPILVVLLFLFINVPLAAGFIFGNLICIEYSSLMLLPILIFLCRKKWVHLCLGIIIGSGNMIIFDLRHQFYNSILLIKYFLHPTGTGISSHHILTVLPLLFIFFSVVLLKVFRGKLIYVILGAIITLQLWIVYENVFNQTQGFRMTKNLTYAVLEKASNLIANDNPVNFNVTQTIDSESRSNAIRYLLTYEYNLGKNLNKYDQYKKSEFLYVISNDGQNINYGGTYELTSFSQNRNTVWEKPLNQYMKLTKLSKN